MAELKECPFCGGEAGEYSLGVTKHSYIKCRVCGAGAPTKPTAAEARAAWNRRPSPENKALTLDELREVVHGHWIKRGYESVPECSNCGAISIEAGKYCRNCGVMMEGKDDSHEDD